MSGRRPGAVVYGLGVPNVLEALANFCDDADRLETPRELDDDVISEEGDAEDDDAVEDQFSDGEQDAAGGDAEGGGLESDAAEEEEPESEEEGGEEEAEAEEEDGFSTADWEALPEDLEDLQLMCLRLQRKAKSLAQKLRARGRRGCHTENRGQEQTDEQRAAAALRREQKAIKAVMKEISYWDIDDCLPKIANRLMFKMTPEQRAVHRGLGAMRQERFLAKRDAMHDLHTHLYTARNSLEIRLRELLPTRALQRMRRVLTEVQDAAGNWSRFVVECVPKTAKEGGNDPLLSRDGLSGNRALKIYEHRHVLAPFPFATHVEMKSASDRLLGGRKSDIAIPSRDGFSGAAWRIGDVAADVFKGAAANLRPLVCRPIESARRTAADVAACGLGGVRRLWLGFDGLKWTAREGLTRWVMGTPDTKTRHQAAKNFWEGITYTGADKNSGLNAATSIGERDSETWRKVTDAGVVVTKLAADQLPQEALSAAAAAAAVAAKAADATQHAMAWAAAMQYECQIILPFGPENEEQLSRLHGGGDRAAGNAAYGMASCVNQKGCCMRCNARKPAWTQLGACKDAVRWNCVLLSLASHIDPRPRMKGFEDIEPLACPYCLKLVTPELQQQTQHERAQASMEQLKQRDAEHTSSHGGNTEGEEVVVFFCPKWRATSNLHRWINIVHNCLVATFMAVPFSVQQRMQANEALDAAGTIVRFPEKNAKQRLKRICGDDARIFNSNPALLIRFFDIFFGEQLSAPEVKKVMDKLAEAAKAAGRLVGPSKKSAQAKRAKAAEAAAQKKPARAPAKKKPKSQQPGVRAGGSKQQQQEEEQQQEAMEVEEAPARGHTRDAMSVEEAAALLDCSVKRFDFGTDATEDEISDMVNLTHANMKGISTREALDNTKEGIHSKHTRIITVYSDSDSVLEGYAAYRINCEENGVPVAYLYELQLKPRVRGSKLGKALIAEAEGRAALSGSGCLQLSCARDNPHFGFYTIGCGYVEVGERTEMEDGKEIMIMELAKKCEREPMDVVADEGDDDEGMEELDTPLERSRASTALLVWLRMIEFRTAVARKVKGPMEVGDFNRDALEEYAREGQAAGKAWALAMQEHTDGKANWQYVHDSFAHVRMLEPQHSSISLTHSLTHPLSALMHARSSMRMSWSTAIPRAPTTPALRPATRRHVQGRGFSSPAARTRRTQPVSA